MVVKLRIFKVLRVNATCMMKWTFGCFFGSKYDSGADKVTYRSNCVTGLIPFDMFRLDLGDLKDRRRHLLTLPALIIHGFK